MELVLTQPGFRRFNEPLNLRREVVKEHLGISEWSDVHGPAIRDKLKSYFGGLCSNDLRDPRFNFRTPFSRFYRPITRRTVFKIIDAGEEHVNWLADTFNGRVVVLLRHPIPVSLSRKYFPKLSALLATNLASYFTANQLALADEVLRGSCKISKGVLDWCLRNTIVLRHRNEAWTVITYEQLVLDPAPVIRLMSSKLCLTRPDRILKSLHVPSRSTHQSNLDTKEVLKSRHRQDQGWLVEKWQREVNAEELDKAAEIMAAFNMNSIYEVQSTLPANSYWIGE